MRILLSNDDGIYAPGIKALAERLVDETIHEIYIVAPDRERSATGHSLTLHKPLRTEAVSLVSGLAGCWSTSGTPSDCVKLAVMELLPSKPDIIISGINSVANLGCEVLYSGTVAAAMEGIFSNILSLAVSCATNLNNVESPMYEAACEFIARFLQIMPRLKVPPQILLNINVPNIPWQEIRGVNITEMGLRLYQDHFEKRLDPRGRTYYWLASQVITEDEAETSDVWAVLHNCISINPIAFNMTHYPTFQRLQSDFHFGDLLHGHATLDPLHVYSQKIPTPIPSPIPTPHSTSHPAPHPARD